MEGDGVGDYKRDGRLWSREGVRKFMKMGAGHVIEGHVYNTEESIYVTRTLT